MATLIANGTVIGPTGATAMDVLIDGERIVALLAPGHGPTGGDVQVIDATGRYVLPGGVDVHVHLDLPMGPTFSADSFESGTRAAAWGGTTTVVDFANQRVGERVQDGLAARHAEAAGNCAVDYGFHQVIGDVNDESLKAMVELIEHEGITSFKLFMAYPGVYYSDDGQILRAMQVAGRHGAMVMMHAENGPAIDVLIGQALGRGDTAPYVHSLTRPVELEEEATHRSIMLAKVARCPLYVVHMSAGEAVEAVMGARDRGANVFGETCPQYLYLSLEEHLMKPGFDGAAYVCSTPLRARADGHQDALWRYLRTDDLSVVSTDHCPFCMKDQKELGRGDFSKIPNGIGSIEHRMDLLYQGVVRGEISLARWVELCCTAPARLFGLYPRKGILQPGSDADIVVYDPSRRTRLGVGMHHMNLDHSAYEGIEIDGGIELVMSRGTIVVRDGRYHGRKGHGRYLERALSDVLI
ncbi:MAG: dihydropyrimidinase [Acidimicrobiales bacterium]|nr:dihydropyrimidinase [Acidimicrobiales bacterium]